MIEEQCILYLPLCSARKIDKVFVWDQKQLADNEQGTIMALTLHKTIVSKAET